VHFVGVSDIYVIGVSDIYVVGVSDIYVVGVSDIYVVGVSDIHVATCFSTSVPSSGSAISLKTIRLYRNMSQLYV
jgi:peroxiredoxin